MDIKPRHPFMNEKRYIMHNPTKGKAISHSALYTAYMSQTYSRCHDNERICCLYTLVANKVTNDERRATKASRKQQRNDGPERHFNPQAKQIRLDLKEPMSICTASIYLRVMSSIWAGACIVFVSISRSCLDADDDGGDPFQDPRVQPMPVRLASTRAPERFLIQLASIFNLHQVFIHFFFFFFSSPGRSAFSSDSHLLLCAVPATVAFLSPPIAFFFIGPFGFIGDPSVMALLPSGDFYPSADQHATGLPEWNKVENN